MRVWRRACNKPTRPARTTGAGAPSPEGASFSTMQEQSTQSVIARLGFESEMAQLRERIARWVADCSEELREALEWQFLTGSKYFRPLTIFSCYRAVHAGPIP